MKWSPASLLMVALLSSCAAPANPPSLLPRAIETRSSAEKPLPSVGAPALEPALVEKLATLVVEARAGDADFARAQQSGAATLAAGAKASFGSESWIAAEQVISALQVARQRSAGALTAIDALAIAQNDRAAQSPSVGGLAEIQLAQAEVEAIVAAQSVVLDRFSR